MFCVKCGTNNPDASSFCSSCGSQLLASGQIAPAPVVLKNWLVEAILVTLFCCMPGGVVAIVFAAQSKSAADIGNTAAATSHAKNAKRWTLISFGVGAAFWCVYIGMVLIGIIAGAASAARHR